MKHVTFFRTSFRRIPHNFHFCIPLQSCSKWVSSLSIYLIRIFMIVSVAYFFFCCWLSVLQATVHERIHIHLLYILSFRLRLYNICSWSHLLFLCKLGKSSLLFHALNPSEVVRNLSHFWPVYSRIHKLHYSIVLLTIFYNMITITVLSKFTC